MGFIFPDLVVEAILEEGLADLRANLDVRLNDLFSQLKENYLDIQYGQNELDRVKTYLTDRRISIVQSWRQIPERIPCICILTTSAPEDSSKAFLNDYAGDIDTFIGDEIQEKFEQKSVPVNSSLQISIHTSDPGGVTALRWLYALVLYWLVSQKETLITRGLDHLTWGSSDFNRLNEFLPENVLSRYITLKFLNYFDWKKKTKEILVDEIEIQGPSEESPESLGGIVAETGADCEYESNTFFTVDEEEEE